MDKRGLRRALQERRQEIKTELHQSLSAELCRHLCQWLRAEGLQQVALYMSFRNEPDLLPLAALCPELILALPVMNEQTRTMTFYHWAATEPLTRNRFGILQPDPLRALACDFAAKKTAVLLPALALDSGGGRLGYGGGYYDRFLSQMTESSHVETVGVVFEAFVLPKLPLAAHDRRVSWLATERGVRRSHTL